MEYQQTHPQATCPSGSEQSGDDVSPELSIPSAKRSIKIKRRRIWGQVHDVEGSLWEVREARSTDHDFDLLFGYPARTRSGAHAGKGPRQLIATPALLAYWEAHRTDRRSNFDFPASVSTLRNLRRRLGFNMILDRRALYDKRIPDMKKLSIPELAARHNLPAAMAIKWHVSVLGRFRRPRGWMQDPAVLEVLRSNLSNSQVGQTLGVTPVYAGRLRKGALARDLKLATESARC